MTDEYWKRKVKELPLAAQQSRYLELTGKIANMVVLSKEELAELIALRDVLQQAARDSQGSKK